MLIILQMIYISVLLENQLCPVGFMQHGKYFLLFSYYGVIGLSQCRNAYMSMPILIANMKFDWLRNIATLTYCSLRFERCILQLSNLQDVSYKKGILKNFAKFEGKHLYQSFFFDKVVGLACNFIKKETLLQVFLCEFCKSFKNASFYRTLLMATSNSRADNLFSSDDIVFFSESVYKRIQTKMKLCM